VSAVVAPCIALGAALVAGLMLTPTARALAHRTGLVYVPAIDRWGRRSTAMLGGAAIALAALAGVLFGMRGTAGALDALGSLGGLEPQPWMGVALASATMFLVGLADDIAHLRPQVKFVLQLLAGVLLISMGAVIALTPWYVANAVITLLWFVAVTNAVNLLDNMDGVAAGVGGIAAFFLGLAFLRTGAVAAAVAAWALSGATLAFLVYNFHPASIFMGDAGSLFVGSLLAGLVASAPGPTSGSFISVMFVPLAICGVPILDTALVTVTRTLAGRGIAQGGRDHSTHRLVALGLSEKQVALLLYAFATVGGLVALVLTRLARDAALIVGTVFLVAMSLLAAYLGRLHVEHPNESRGSRHVTILMTKLLYKRRLAEILLDVVLVSLAWYAAFRLRFDGRPPAEYAAAFEDTLLLVVAGKILLFAVFGVYRGTWQYASMRDLLRVVGAILTGAVVLFVAGDLLVPALARSHSLVYIDALCTAALVLSSRVSFRALELARHSFVVATEPGEAVMIYGAGDAGELALREINNNHDLGLLPVCFLDDDVRKHGRYIHGVPVVGGLESVALAAERYRAKVLVIGTRKLKPHVVEAVQGFAERSGLKIVELDLGFRPMVAATASGAERPVRPVSPLLARAARGESSGERAANAR